MSSDSTRHDLLREPRKFEWKENNLENNIIIDTTVVMSLRLLCGLEKNEQMDTQEPEEDRERKKRSLGKGEKERC